MTAPTPINGPGPACGSAAYFVSGVGAQRSAAVGLRPGEVLLSRYTIHRELGRGATACVYLAHDAIRGADLALKAMLLGAGWAGAAAGHLRHELGLYDRIQSYEHIIRVYDAHLEPRGGGALLLLAMEHADGDSLRRWLADHESDCAARVDQGLEYFKQACRGVAVLHDAGLTHRDIKPENMLLVSGVLKLSDLGCSLSSQTVDGGTQAYMSPERRCPGADADIWALGAVLYEILSSDGRPPYGGGHQNSRRSRPAPLPADAGIAGEVAMRCLSTRPQDRFATVDELLEALEASEPAAGPETRGTGSLSPQVAWERALGYAAGQPDQAMRLCREVLQAVPDHAAASLLLEKLERNHEQAHRIYAAIEAGIGHQPLGRLTPLLTQAVELFPNHPDGQVVQGRLHVLVRDYAGSMAEGIEALRRRDWEGAMSCFEHARSISPGSHSTTRAISFVGQIKREIQERRELIHTMAERRPQRALELARDLDRFIDDTIQAVTQAGDAGDAR